MSASGPADPELSVVVPVFNEEGSLDALYAELQPVVARVAPSHEFVFVDDGSRDRSPEILARLAAADPHVRIVRLDRNHGLSSALHCGFHRARGAIVATLDSDLQNDPSDLPKLVDEVRSGRADMACGWRRDRIDPFVKKVSSRIANAWRNSRTGESVHDITCPLKAFRREVRDVFLPFDGMHRFLPTLARMAGHRVVEIPVGHRARVHGSSKYGVWNRLFRGMKDLRAVRWMQERRMTYRATELTDRGGDGG